MQLPILIEPVEGGRFRAQSGPPFSVVAEGATEAEAAQGLSKLIEEQLSRGARVATIRLSNGAPPSTPSPFPADDLYKTDWVFRELQEAIEENRRQEATQNP